MVHGKLNTTSEQSGLHCPVAGSRESPFCTRPDRTTRVLTGATTGIWSVSLVGTTLLSLAPQLLAVVRGTPGTSTLSTELTTRNCSMAPSTGSNASPCKACANVTAPSGLLPLV